MESKIRTPIYLAYTCSSCGKLVKKGHMVVESIYVDSKSSIVWEGDPPTPNSTKPIEHGKKIQKILAEAERHCYRTAEFNCSCDACNHQEPWSKMRYTLFDTIAGTMLPIGILLAFASWIAGLTLLGMVGVYLLIKYWHRSSMELQIEELPPKSLPTISLNPEDIKAIIE